MVIKMQCEDCFDYIGYKEIHNCEDDMSKIGVSISIDVSKIDKSRLFEGKKGKYLDLTTFIDTSSKDQYDNNGFITQSTSKEERDGGLKLPILGNVKVFMDDSSPPASNQATPDFNDFDSEELPF